MLKIKKIILLFVGMAILLSTNQAYSQESAGEDMLKRCEQEGPDTIVSQFTREDWDLLAKKIAAGDNSWIRASACLDHGITYGGKGDFIDYGWWVVTEARVQALLKNPVTILNAATSLRGSCRLPLEADRGSIEFADDFLRQALASLDGVKNDYLEVSKKACQLYLTLDHERVIKRLKERK